jgi:HK97 family phage major capsid protein
MHPIPERRAHRRFRVPNAVTVHRWAVISSRKGLLMNRTISDAEWRLVRDATLSNLERGKHTLPPSCIAEQTELLRRGEAGDQAARAQIADRPDPNVPVPNARYTPTSDDPTATREYREAFLGYARATLARSPISEQERRVLSVTSDPAGGYTVPADVRAAILSQVPAASPLLRLIQTPDTSRDSIVWPRVQPHGSSPDIYTSAFVGSMIAEVPSASAGQNEPSFGQFEIALHKARAMALVTRDLAEDTEFDILSFLQDDGAVNLALLRESQIISGTGVGPNNKGLIQYNGGTSNTSSDLVTAVDVDGSGDNVISNTPTEALAGTGSLNKIISTIYDVPAQYRRSPSFAVVMNSNTEKLIRQFQDGEGNLIFGPAWDGKSLLGYPLVISEFLGSSGNADTVVIIAGDWSQVVSPQRAQITAQVALERYTEIEQVGIFLRQRFGVGLANPRAFRFGVTT